jgi:hypothetical protein
MHSAAPTFLLVFRTVYIHQGAVIWAFFRIQFVHAFLDRKWDPETNILNTFLHIFSLFLADFVFSCRKGVCSTSLYVVCIYGAICIQIQKYFPPDRVVFSPTNKILILFYVVFKFMRKKIQDFMAKRQEMMFKKFFGDISHRTYKLRRDIE